MNEDNYNVRDDSLENKPEEAEKNNYSYQFNANKSAAEFDNPTDAKESSFLEGQQPNKGKSLVKLLGGSKNYPYGIRGNWSNGIISVLGIAIILGIFALIIISLVH